MTPDQELMQRVDTICGPLFDAISPPTHPATSYPKAFIMALTANETGIWLVHNDVVPSRFEETVYAHLLDVLDARTKGYGSITAQSLDGATLDQLHDYSTSWGLTQIMGYECLAWKVALTEIQNPATHYNYTLRLLNEFERQYMLDPEKDFMEFARCWNAGGPHGKTFDPNYAQNLVDRMEAWEGLKQ